MRQRICVLSMVLVVGCPFEGGYEGAGSGGAVSISLERCGQSCSADLAEAERLLQEGRYAEAHELFRCADSPEAAFGAGLTTLMLSVESEPAVALLDDLGLPPLRARHLFGDAGLLSRTAARYQGSGTLSVSGDLSREITLSRVQLRLENQDGDAGYVTLEAHNLDAGLDAELWIDHPSGQVPAGQPQQVSYECDSPSPFRTGNLPYVSLELTLDGEQYECSVPYNLDVQSCEADGGSLTLAAPAAAVGQSARYELSNLLMHCENYDDGGDVAPLSGPTPPALALRVSGAVEATAVSDRFDASDLHPLFGDGDDLLSSVRSDRSLSEFVTHAEGTTRQFAQASCFFHQAAGGRGTVFTVPGDLHGGRDVEVSAGDSEVLSAISALVAAAGVVVSSYDADMPLNDVLCEGDACPSDAELAEAFNASFAQNVDVARIRSAEPLVHAALTRMDEGIGQLDGTSFFVRDASTEAVLLKVQETARAGLNSLERGVTRLPNVEPDLLFDLRALFDEPPVRDGIATPPLRYEEECDDIDCYSDVYIDEDFAGPFLERSLMLDWDDADYEFVDGQGVEDGLRSIGRSMERATVVSD